MSIPHAGPSVPYSLMLHGGALPVDATPAPDERRACLASLDAILSDGRDILAGGGSALEAVERCVCRLEDDPLFNAGRGSVLNEAGRVEMDAAIMDGRDLAAGGVAAVATVANPISLAQRVMRYSGHVLLVGAGAEQFARDQGIAEIGPDYLVTARRLAQYRERQGGAAGTTGTVGAVARDTRGDLAAATSTGGTAGKRAGRVGDTPLIGAGVYADNACCAVSATGHGEDFMRTVLAKAIADRIELQRLDAGAAAQAGIDYLRNRIGGQGGVIVIDRAGRCRACFTPGDMIHGWIEHGAPAICSWGGELG
jgi:beta-aspartyl-peptidase (threonine type)